MKKNFLILLVLFFTLGVALSAGASTIGNDVVNRAKLDTATNSAFVDPTLIFTNSGTIDFWEVWIQEENRPFALQIYTPSSGSEYTLSAQELYSSGVSTTGYNKLNPTSTMSVNTGDVIGWWFGSLGGVIPYSSSGADHVGWNLSVSVPTVGATYDFDNSSYDEDLTIREYSISANAVPEPATMLLFGIGLLGLAEVSRRKK